MERSKSKSYHPKNNFLTAVFYIALMSIVIVAILFLFFYQAFSNFAKEQTMDASRSITERICYSISEMNDSIRNLCITQFYDSDVQYLMHAEKLDSIEVQQTIARLKRSAASNLDIQSIITYNYKTGRTISTVRGITDIDEPIKQILQQDEIPYLTPIPRELTQTDYYTSGLVFSYVIYDTYQARDINCAMIVNINDDWLTESLKKQTESQENLIVFDDQFRQIASTVNDIHNLSQSVPNYAAELLGTSGIIEATDGEKYFISVSAITGTNWYLLRQVPFSVMLSKFHTLEKKLLLFTTGILILALAISVFVVRGIYRPIRKIASLLQLQNYAPEIPAPRMDALNYISQTLEQVDHQYRHIQETAQLLVQRNLLRSMLLGVTPSGLDEQSVQHARASILDALSPYYMVLLRMDHAASYTKLSQEQRRLLVECLSDYLHQTLPMHTDSPLIDTAPGDFVVFMEQDPQAYIEALRTVQNEFLRQTGFSIRIFAESDQDRTSSSVFHRRFSQLLRVSKYRMYRSVSCLIYGSDCLTLEKQPFMYPEQLAASLKSALRRSDETESLLLYDQFALAAQDNSTDNYKLCMMQLFASFQSVWEERSSYALTSTIADMDQLYHQCFHAEFSQQYDDVFREFIVRFCTTEQKIAAKHNVILETVRDYINLHYSNTELSLKLIAAELQISQSYLGKLFREEYGLSVKDYITNVRLETAAKNLTTTTMSIRQIMELSGYDSESNFYRLFKSCYGVTPSNYRLSHSLQKTQDSQT